MRLAITADFVFFLLRTLEVTPVEAFTDWRLAGACAVALGLLIIIRFFTPMFIYEILCVKILEPIIM
jgi:hypothetical protein